MCLFVSLQGDVNTFVHVTLVYWNSHMDATLVSACVWVCVCVCDCLCMRVTLTDAGAEVSVFPVAPMVVGVTVVAAHRLQLDLLDLHGLCDGRVGSCCRRRCQAWGEEVEETWLLKLRLCTCKKFAGKTCSIKKNKQGRVSQRRRRHGCEVTIWCFIFWQPILSQQVIPLMGWIPVHGSIICFLYECFTNSHAPRQYIDAFAPWFEPFRSSGDAAHKVWAEAEYIAQTGWCSVTAEGSGRGKGEREIRIKDVDKDRKKKTRLPHIELVPMIHSLRPEWY